VWQSGVAELDGTGRILGFVEKPRPGETQSHWVNAGIYILEPAVLGRIPASGAPDFGRDVFPAMLAAEVPLAGYCLAADEGLWWIDRPEDLARVNQEWEEKSA
jgi:NDP-sugar pyrophosphorylase family protein